MTSNEKWTMPIYRWIVPVSALIVVGCIVLAAEETAPSGAGSVIGREADTASAWQIDFVKARTTATDTGRPILALFEGSDWCPWCKKLRDEVFSQAAFKTYAAEKLVLFVADFPLRKTLPEAEVEQNDALLKTYSVEGFPTVLLIDGKGKELARTGYLSGGAEKYVENLTATLAKAEKQKSETASPSEGGPVMPDPSAKKTD